MNGRYLLDTNIVIALFARESSITQRLQSATEIFIPSIVLGELYYGALNSLKVADNLARIDKFRTANTILSFARLATLTIETR